MRHLIAAVIILLGSTAMAATTAPVTKTAIFAGGCFWCMQPSYDTTKGVSATRVGYTGGPAKTATYEQVSGGKSGHVEAIEVTYDPATVAYEALVETFFENIDPTDAGGQFADRGSQYHTAIFYADATQKAAAEKAKVALAAKFAPAPIAVAILPAQPFYEAEADHQKYYQKNKAHYSAYKTGSGRAGYIEKTWGKK
ncbi:MAG: peptide-methionine (S)-S-oxide reductase MsrA [Pseudomonadota bacterium]